MDQETALEMVKKGGTLLLLDVPQFTFLGIDTQMYSVGPNFKGIKMLPPGPHFVYYCPSNKNGHEFSPTLSCFIVTHSSEFIRVVHFQLKLGFHQDHTKGKDVDKGTSLFLDDDWFSKDIFLYRLCLDIFPLVLDAEVIEGGLLLWTRKLKQMLEITLGGILKMALWIPILKKMRRSWQCHC